MSQSHTEQLEPLARDISRGLAEDGAVVCVVDRWIIATIHQASFHLHLDRHGEAWEASHLTVSHPDNSRRFDLLYLLAIRPGNYWAEVKGLHSVKATHHLLTAKAVLLIKHIVSSYPYITRGDITELLHNNYYSRVETLLAPLFLEFPMQYRIRHPFIYAKYLRGDVSWMSDLIYAEIGMCKVSRVS
jgi:hypothetical protein